MTGNPASDPSERLDPATIGFRRLVADDLSLMYRWLQQPAILEWWWGGVPPAYAAVEAKYSARIRGEEPTDPYLILSDDQPIGYIQAYMIADHPEYAAQIAADADAAGVDLFIGAMAYLHRGLGSHILRSFLREIVFGTMGAGSCIIGPDERNAIAIRAYEKAGFRYLKTVHIPDEDAPEYLMCITSADLIIAPQRHRGPQRTQR
jgi:RimJ/RimL family protein N-acetyltransferase